MSAKAHQRIPARRFGYALRLQESVVTMTSPQHNEEQLEPEHWPDDFPELATIMEKIERDHDNGKAAVSSAYSVAPLVNYIERATQQQVDEAYKRGRRKMYADIVNSLPDEEVEVLKNRLEEFEHGKTN